VGRGEAARGPVGARLLLDDDRAALGVGERAGDGLTRLQADGGDGAAVVARGARLGPVRDCPFGDGVGAWDEGARVIRCGGISQLEGLPTVVRRREREQLRIAAGALEQKAFEFDSEEARDILDQFDQEGDPMGE